MYTEDWDISQPHDPLPLKNRSTVNLSVDMQALCLHNQFWCRHSPLGHWQWHALTNNFLVQGVDSDTELPHGIIATRIMIIYTWRIIMRCFSEWRTIPDKQRKIYLARLGCLSGMVRPVRYVCLVLLVRYGSSLGETPHYYSPPEFTVP